jgi:3-hydroxypropanoate dehydrogenase
LSRLNDASLDTLFRTARTRNGWQDKPLSDAIVREIYELTKWGPTSANSCPARFVFVRSDAAKQRLKPYLLEANVGKTMAAPCCVIVAYDTQFYELMPQLFPDRGVQYGAMFRDNPAVSEDLVHRNSALQGAYLMIVARALGLDVGAMSGFDKQGVDREFFPDGRWKSNFLCNIGYGSDENLFPRNPRLKFDEACLDI